MPLDKEIENNNCKFNTDDVVDTRKNLPVRKSPRAAFHDYCSGDYFITICTRNKIHYFGRIINGEMLLSEIGRVAEEKLRRLHDHYSYAEVVKYVVMPNHIHAIICINADSSPNTDSPVRGRPAARKALSVVVGGFKSAVTLYARRNNIDFSWQSRYHDHIIRGPRDGNRISDYIVGNVSNWAFDCFYPKLETS